MPVHQQALRIDAATILSVVDHIDVARVSQLREVEEKVVIREKGMVEYYLRPKGSL